MHVDITGYSGVMARFAEGIRQFRQTEYRGDRELMQQLQQGQKPELLLVGCCDSRVDFSLLAGVHPGEVFTVRNIANLVPPYDYGGGTGQGVRAAIEYGVKMLQVSHIVVFGHAQCGGIKAAIDTAAGDAPASDFIGSWLVLAQDACCQETTDSNGKLHQLPAAALKEYSYLVERASVLNSLANLRGYPWVVERVAAGTLTLHGWWFDLQTGDLWVTAPNGDTFMPLDFD